MTPTTPHRPDQGPLPPGPSLELADGTSIPQIGFGTYKIPAGETREAVLLALGAGYRHIDTAQMYGNEEGVGAALRDSGLGRDEVYVTTKLDNTNHKPSDADRTMDESLTRLGVDAVDLFLVHWPLTTEPELDLVETWRAMEAIHRSGRARSIGVSNFQPHHLRTLADAGTQTPVLNQVEVHPWLANDAVRRDAEQRGITIAAWSPLGRGAVLEDPAVVAIAERLGATPAQVIVRWHMDEGRVVIPKSAHAERIRSNLDVFGLALTDEDRAAIRALDRGEDGRQGSHPDAKTM